MEVFLVQKAKRHNKEAFSKLMHLYGESMYKVAKAILKNDEDVADAMQETVLNCWEKIHTLKNDELFKTWMIRILINNCNSIYRHNLKFIPNNELPENISKEDQYTNIEWMEMLENLDEKQRVVIELYYVEGFKVREIAEILQVSESAVKRRMAEARKKIERLYSENSVIVKIC